MPQYESIPGGTQQPGPPGSDGMAAINAGLLSARTVGTQIVVEKYEELKAMVREPLENLSPGGPARFGHASRLTPHASRLTPHASHPNPQAMSGGITFRLLSFAGGVAMVGVRKGRTTTH